MRLRVRARIPQEADGSGPRAGGARTVEHEVVAAFYRENPGCWPSLGNLQRHRGRSGRIQRSADHQSFDVWRGRIDNGSSVLVRPVQASFVSETADAQPIRLAKRGVALVPCEGSNVGRQCGFRKLSRGQFTRLGPIRIGEWHWIVVARIRHRYAWDGKQSGHCICAHPRNPLAQHRTQLQQRPLAITRRHQQRIATRSVNLGPQAEKMYHRKIDHGVPTARPSPGLANCLPPSSNQLLIGAALRCLLAEAMQWILSRQLARDECHVRGRMQRMSPPNCVSRR